MNTPRKNYDNLESPYAKHLPQYPSQSEEYLPLELGGPGAAPTSHGKGQSQQHRNGRFTSTPAKGDNFRGDGNGRGRFDTAHRFSSGGGNFTQNRLNNRGRGNNRFQGGAGNNRNSYGGDNSGGGGGQRGFENNHQRQQNRYSGFGNRGAGGSGTQQRFKHNQNSNDISQYFHPSMLEDPWRELMERHNAIRNSQIDLQPQQQEDKTEEVKMISIDDKNEQPENSKNEVT